MRREEYVHLVDRRTPYVALAILGSFSARVASVYHSRELGKAESETELSAKQQKASSRIATMNRVLSLLAYTGTRSPNKYVNLDLTEARKAKQSQLCRV